MDIVALGLSDTPSYLMKGDESNASASTRSNTDAQARVCTRVDARVCGSREPFEAIELEPRAEAHSCSGQEPPAALKSSSPCPSLSIDRHGVPFYHSTFEFYAPFPVDLVPFISLGEYERLLTFLNTQLPADLPARSRRLSWLFRAFVCLLLLGGLGLLVLPYLYCESSRYERDFRAFLMRVAAVLIEKNLVFARRNIGFSLRDAQLRRVDLHQASEWRGNLYHYSISIDTLTVPPKTAAGAGQSEQVLQSHTTATLLA